MEENVATLPTRLERLAGKLSGFLSREKANREDWIAVQEGICLTLVEIRDQFPADIDFGRWCEQNGFGSGVLNSHARAAAIAMGRQPEALRPCLEATERRSLELIYRFDFGRFASARKPTARRERQPKLPTPGLDRALEAHDNLAAKGHEATKKAVAEAAGVGPETAARAILQRKVEAQYEPPLAKADMSASLERRFNAALRRAREEIRAEVTAEVLAQFDRHLAHYRERDARATRVLRAYQGVMSRDLYRKIKACLHPDHNGFAHAAEVFQAFAELEDALVKPDEALISGPALPSSAAELLARRRA